MRKKKSTRAPLKIVSRSAETVYAAALHKFVALVNDRPAEAALKIQLLHYLPDSTFRSRDVLDWTLTGAMVGLLSHYAEAPQLHQANGMAAAFRVVFGNLLEPWDALILAHTETTGWRLTVSEPVFARITFWELHDGRKFEAWTKAANKAANIQRQAGKRPPLDDPHFPEAARTTIAQIETMLKRLASQTLTAQKPPDLIDFFREQAGLREFSFLNDPHNLNLWLAFARRNRNRSIFAVESAADIFDRFQSQLSGHAHDYVRQKRSRA